MQVIDIEVDPEQREFDRLISWAKDELAALEDVIPLAVDVQWTTPPADRPREDTTERAKNLRTDTTASVALDPKRMALREQVVRSSDALRVMLVTVRGVRLGLETMLEPWGRSESDDRATIQA